MIKTKKEYYLKYKAIIFFHFYLQNFINCFFCKHFMQTLIFLTFYLIFAGTKLFDVTLVINNDLMS